MNRGSKLPLRAKLFTSSTQAEFPFVKAWLLLPVLLAWVLSTAWLVVRFRALDSDSIMYGLPLAFAHGPFSLSVPMLGDFPPYSTVWGHQWPGSMWLRGAIFSVIPFQRWIDVAFLLALQFSAAFLVGKLVWALAKDVLASLVATLIVLSDRVVIAGAQLHRFEPLVILALVALLASLVATAGNPSETAKSPRGAWLLAGSASAFVAACSHPFALAIAIGLIGIGGIDCFVLLRRKADSVLLPLFGLILGLVAITGYFFGLPDAFAQFKANVTLQNSFNDLSRFAFISHLRYYKILGLVLWGGVIIAIPYVFFRLHRRQSAREAFAAWTLPLAALSVPTLFFLTRSANNNYVALGIPFATIVVAVAVGIIPRDNRKVIRLGVLAVFVVIALGFASVYPYRWFIFFRSGCPDFPAAMRRTVDRLPEGARVFIPPPLWDAARQDRRRDYRLNTLAIASPWERRLAYEKLAYAEAKPGDILIVDRISGTTGDPWGIMPTFEARPPDAKFWKPLFEEVFRVPGAGHDFGYDLAVYEFRGIPWDPATTPRAMTGR